MGYYLCRPQRGLSRIFLRVPTAGAVGYWYAVGIADWSNFSMTRLSKGWRVRP